MKFKGKFIVILSIILFFGMFIQFTRLNKYLRVKSNEVLIDVNECDKGEKLDTDFINSLSKKEYLIIYDKGMSEIKDNIEKTLDYMQLEYKSVTDKEFYGNVENNIKNIILVINDISDIDDARLFDYVYNGKNVFIANNLYNVDMEKDICTILGIKETGGFTETFGIEFLENIMIKSKNIKLDEEDLLPNAASQLEVTDDTKVYAVSNDGIPLVWSREYGKGTIFNFNGTMLGEKLSRGFIAGIIGNMGDAVIYPVMNSKINYLDDFPSPVPDGSNEYVSSEYNLTIRRFYKEIWWPDMLKTATENDIKYTGVIIGSYNDNVSAKNDFPIEVYDGDFEFYTRELLLAGGELGIHGYNHQPLTLSELNNESLGYRKWESQESMVKAIRTVYEYAKTYVEGYDLAVYVPPSNIIKEDGIEALKTANPEFKILASLNYTSETSDEFAQELEVREDGIINLPRLTSGYLYDDNTRWDLMNGVTLNGYLSHFIHPDDVLDPDRNNGYGWKELSKQYGELQSDVFKDYSWMEPSTATEGANKLIKYLNTKVYYEKRDGSITIYCDNFIGPVEFILRSEKEISNTENCSAKKIDEGTYLVKAEKSTSRLNF